MTLASRHWWREMGLKVVGGLMIFAGILITSLSHVVVPQYAGIGLIVGLAMVGVGAFLILLARI